MILGHRTKTQKNVRLSYDLFEGGEQEVVQMSSAFAVNPKPDLFTVKRWNGRYYTDSRYVSALPGSGTALGLWCVSTSRKSREAGLKGGFWSGVHCTCSSIMDKPTNNR